MNNNSLFSKEPIQISEAFNDINKMTMKELEKEFHKNLKKIDELTSEMKADKDGYPKFSIQEQLDELIRYNEKVLNQINELKAHGIDTTAYESVIADLMASYEKSYQAGAITKDELETYRKKLEARISNVEFNDKRRQERELEEKKKAQAAYDKKHPIKTFKRKLSEYNKKK